MELSRNLTTESFFFLIKMGCCRYCICKSFKLKLVTGDMSNYRPISILPTLSKIFEKLIYKQFYKFFEDNDIIYNCQFGFRQNHSTIHAIQAAINSGANSLNSSYHTMGIFIDFSKAFGTIQHTIFLQKIRTLFEALH